MREQRGEIAAAGARCIAVGFSPAPALVELAAHVAWPWPFVTDEARSVYARLGAARATWRNVYTPATLRRYLRAAVRGVRIHAPSRTRASSAPTR